MPNSYPVHPAYNDPPARSRIMPNWKLEGSAVVWDENAPDPVEVAVAEVVFDPSDHTVGEVKKYLGSHPDETQAVYDAELAGKARSSLLDWLTED